MHVWADVHVCAIQVLSVLRLPLGFCSKSDRNPGRLPDLSPQLGTCHIFIFKGSKIDSSGSDPRLTPHTPPVSPIQPGEPVPEPQIQAKYQTSCRLQLWTVHSSFEVYLHCSHPSPSPFFKLQARPPFVMQMCYMIKIASGEEVQGQHIVAWEMCWTEWAWGIEQRERRGCFFFCLMFCLSLPQVTLDAVCVWYMQVLKRNRVIGGCSCDIYQSSTVKVRLSAALCCS